MSLKFLNVHQVLILLATGVVMHKNLHQRYFSSFGNEYNSWKYNVYCYLVSVVLVNTQSDIGTENCTSSMETVIGETSIELAVLR